LISYIYSFLEWGKTLPLKERNDLISSCKAVHAASAAEFEKNLPEVTARYPTLSEKQRFLFPQMMGNLLSVSNRYSFPLKNNSKLFIREFVSFFLEEENYLLLKESLDDLLDSGFYAHEHLSVYLSESKSYSGLMNILFSFYLEKQGEYPKEPIVPTFFRDALSGTLGVSYFQYLDEEDLKRTFRRLFHLYLNLPLEPDTRSFLFHVFLRIALEESGQTLENKGSVSPLFSWYDPTQNTPLNKIIASRFLAISLGKGEERIAYLSGDRPVFGVAMTCIWQFYQNRSAAHRFVDKELFLEKTAMIIERVLKYPFLVTADANGEILLYPLLVGFENLKEKLPETIGQNQILSLFLLDKYLQSATENPQLWEKKISSDGESGILDRTISLIIETAFYRKNKNSEGNNIALFQSILTFALEEILPVYPNELGITLVRIIVSPDTGFGFRYGFDRSWADQMIEAALALFSQHPYLITSENTWDDLFFGVSAVLRESNLQDRNLLPEITRMILEKSSLQLDLKVSLEQGDEEYLLICGLREILAALSVKEASSSGQLQLTPGQLIAFVELLLDVVIKNPNWLTTSFAGRPLIREVLVIPFRTLSKIPADQRLGYDLLVKIIEISLEAVERSPHLMDRISYGVSPSEKTVLEHAFHLIIAWLFPPGERAGLHKTRQLMDVFTYSLEDLVSENPNSTGLAILELILSDAVGLDLSHGIIEDQTDELVEAVLLAIATQPELIQEAPGLREIAQESAGAIHLLSVDHPEIGLEILRHLFEESAGRLTILLEVNGNQFRHLLIEALQQFATAVSMERKNGRYTIKLSEDQILDLVQIIFEGVVEQPEWVEEAYIHQVLHAILQAVDARSGGRRIPYLLISLLFQALLPMAQERSELLEKISFGGKREATAISYVVERLLNLLLGLELKDWRKVTQDEAIEAIVHFYLNLINQWDMSAASIEAAMTHLKQIVRQFATGTLSQDEFLDLLSEDPDDED
jgi:hypothetical protein